MFELSDSHHSTTFVDNALNYLSEIEKPGSVTETDHLSFEILMSNVVENGAYTYTGSLTTPPCTEEITWFVSMKPLPINVGSYEKLKKVLRFNSRFTQNALGEENPLANALAAR